MEPFHYLSWREPVDRGEWEVVLADEVFFRERAASSGGRAELFAAYARLFGDFPLWLDLSQVTRRLAQSVGRGELTVARRVSRQAAVLEWVGSQSAPAPELPWDEAPPDPQEAEAPPAAPPPEPQPTATHFIEVAVVDSEDRPIANRPWLLTLPDGSERSGTLGSDGTLRVDGVGDLGTCTLHFPTDDELEWRPPASAP